MSKNWREDLDERVRINRVLTCYLLMDSWTPAMGAQLICGLQPVPDCTGIPVSACLLKTPNLPATNWQVNHAKRVLTRFIEEWQEDDVDVPSKISPTDFITWSEDSYINVGGSNRPEWLDYILTLCHSPSGSAPPAPAPAPFGLPEHALGLEHAVSVIAAHSTSQKSTSATTSQSFQARVVKLVEKGKIKSSIAVVIARAMDEAKTPYLVGEIWARLCEFAEKKEEPTLKYKEPMAFEVQYGGKRWNPYTKEALSAQLGRIKAALKDD